MRGLPTDPPLAQAPRGKGYRTKRAKRRAEERRQRQAELEREATA